MVCSLWFSLQVLEPNHSKFKLKIKPSWALAGFRGYLATMSADTVDPTDGLTDGPTNGTGETSQHCGVTAGRPSLKFKV